MYHRRVHVCIYADGLFLENALKGVPTPDNLECVVTTSASPDPALAADSSIIILDRPWDDQTVRRIHEARRGDSFFAVCVDSGDFDAAAQSYSYYDEVWLKPLDEKKIAFLFGRVAERIKGREDAWITDAWLEALIDSLPDLIWFKDARGAHLRVNESFCDAVGKTKADIRGRGHYYIWDIEPDEYARGEYVCLESEEIVLREKKNCLFDEIVKIKDSLRKFKTYKSPIFDRDGRVLGTVGVARDVTDLQNLQIEMNILFESLPFGVVATDRQRRITALNNKARTLFPSRVGSLIGQDFDTLFDALARNASSRRCRIEREGEEVLFQDQGRVFRLQQEMLRDVFGESAGYIHLFLDVTEDHQKQRELIVDANTDYLTQLNNRRKLHDFLRDTQCMSGTSLLLMDIDNFKQMNDTHGHDEGDRVLVAFSEILRDSFDTENIFRLGGDEFAVIFPGAGQTAEKALACARDGARKIIAETKARAIHRDLSVSIGVAAAADSDEDFGALFKKADIALYDAKCAGKNTCCVWECSP
jgi:diguanylate cyclase (GGDEF)-like protein/PAS domain S-box-containing protein